MIKSDFGTVKDIHEQLYGHRPCTGTVCRWTRVGRKVRGQVRKLRVAKVNGIPHTRAEWLREFIEEHNEPAPASERGPTAKQLERSQAAAEAFLTAEKI